MPVPAMQTPYRQPAVSPSPHPMDQADRQTILTLLSVESPLQIDIVQAARLSTRYRDSLLSPDLYAKLQQVLANWSMTPSELQEKSRAIWMSHWRPSPQGLEQAEVGSGADVEG